MKTNKNMQKYIAEAIATFALIFIGIEARKSENPECISAQILRAIARATTSSGQRFCNGNCSAKNSQIAKESQTTMPSANNTGTLPAREYSQYFLINICNKNPRKSLQGRRDFRQLPA